MPQKFETDFRDLSAAFQATLRAAIDANNGDIERLSGQLEAVQGEYEVVDGMLSAAVDEMVDQRLRCRAWTREHGEDHPAIRDWKWST